ncbi:MAG: transglutaminase-like domain-containing protein [Acetivibrio sp.]
MKNMGKRVFQVMIILLLSMSCFGKAKAGEVGEDAIKENEYAVIDCSNKMDGYMEVQYKKSTSKKVKTQVTGPSGIVYTYDIIPGRNEILPLSDGNGTYKTAVFQNITGTKYSMVLSQSFELQLKNEFAPFLRSNQFVNYNKNSMVVKKAKSLTKGIKDPTDQIKKVYDFVTTNFTYDKKKAATVKSGYLPNVDSVLKKKKGICFDYAAVMAAMLRSKNIPTKLVVGYNEGAYHAWLNVYTKETGWMDQIISFNGNTWKIMDPTLASAVKSNKDVKKHIGDGSTYKSKYIY